jgi:hypothetical protein
MLHDVNLEDFPELKQFTDLKRTTKELISFDNKNTTMNYDLQESHDD